MSLWVTWSTCNIKLHVGAVYNVIGCVSTPDLWALSYYKYPIKIPTKAAFEDNQEKKNTLENFVLSCADLPKKLLYFISENPQRLFPTFWYYWSKLSVCEDSI